MQERCTRCKPEFCTYPQHVQYASANHPFVLGSKDAFCEGLFHVFPAPEFQIKQHGSLSGCDRDNCRVSAMTLVVMCGNIIARFTNCNRKHAEEFMVCDKKLFYYVRTFKPKAMVMFMKHHPCNRSSGNARRYPDGYLFNNQADKKSCTLQIIRYYNEVLKPNGVQLLIKTSFLYKANWKFAVRDDDKQTVANSLAGLELMMDAGIKFSAMLPRDWILMANLCNEPIPLTILLSESRLKADRGIQAFLDNVLLQKRNTLDSNDEEVEQNNNETSEVAIQSSPFKASNTNKRYKMA